MSPHPMPRLRLLLVEDVPLFARSLRALLGAASDVEIDLQHVETLDAALQALAQERYDCVLLDLHLPDGQGMDCLERLRAQDARTTIVVLTGVDDHTLAVEALRRGAQEYAVKGEHDPDDLARLILHAIERNRLVNALNEQRMREVEAARHDALTGLPNRQLLAERTRSVIAAARQQGARVGLVYLDLDGFKAVNDRYGHDAGDATLAEIARVLRQAVREPDIASRVGGDEFVVLLNRINEPAEARMVAERLIRRIGAIKAVAGHDISIGASAGVALHPDHGGGFEALMSAADAAMYEAKRAGKNTVRVHGPGSLLPDRPDGKAAPLDPELNWLPWTDTQGRGVRGVVAAYRGPEVWDEAARRGATDVLAQSLLQQALEAWCQWRDGGFAPPRLTIGIQAAELGAADFVARRMAALQQHGVAPAVLELQLLEDAVPALQPHALDQLQELQRAGVRLAVAGVGATDAALWPLARLPLDAVELDPRLVAEMARGDRTARAVCAALVALGAALGVERRAAGVEDAAAAAACRQIGCDGLAGSEVSGWMSTQDCGAWLAERNRMAAGGTV